MQSAADIGRDIEAGRADPVALAEACLGAATPDVYARTMPDRALAEAASARDRAARGVRRHPLDGVPISWKDLIDVAGVGCEGGSQLLAGRVPDADAETVAQAGHRGLVGIGKTHLTELAFSGLGINPKTATPPGLRPGWAPGGSSSGAAASVRLGQAAAAVGSDTGGSVRTPAAWQGLVGLKTSVGALPMGGVLPLAPSFDTLGPLTRTVEDAGLMLEALGGPAMPNPATAPDPSDLRLAVCDTVAFDDIAAPVAAAFEAALARLPHAERRALPHLTDALALAPILFTSETWGTWGHLIDARGDEMHPPVRDRFASGRAHRAADYVRAWADIRAMRARHAAALADVDALILPTVPILPPDVDACLADDALFTATNLMALRNTRIGNLMDMAGLTLPIGDGVGLSILVPAGQERRLVQIGLTLERALT